MEPTVTEAAVPPAARRLLLPLAAAAGLLACAHGDAVAASKPREAATVPGRYIVVYEPGTSAPAAKTDRLERARGFRASLRYGRALKGFAARLSAARCARCAPTRTWPRSRPTGP